MSSSTNTNTSEAARQKFQMSKQTNKRPREDHSYCRQPSFSETEQEEAVPEKRIVQIPEVNLVKDSNDPKFKYTCRRCLEPIPFQREDSFLIHVRRHFAPGHFRCPITTCQKGFVRLVYCLMHEIKYHKSTIGDNINHPYYKEAAGVIREQAPKLKEFSKPSDKSDSQEANFWSDAKNNRRGLDNSVDVSDTITNSEINVEKEGEITLSDSESEGSEYESYEQKPNLLFKKRDIYDRTKFSPLLEAHPKLVPESYDYAICSNSFSPYMGPHVKNYYHCYVQQFLYGRGRQAGQAVGNEGAGELPKFTNKSVYASNSSEDENETKDDNNSVITINSGSRQSSVITATSSNSNNKEIALISDNNSDDYDYNYAMSSEDSSESELSLPPSPGPSLPLPDHKTKEGYLFALGLINRKYDKLIPKDYHVPSSNASAWLLINSGLSQIPIKRLQLPSERMGLFGIERRTRYYVCDRKLENEKTCGFIAATRDALDTHFASVHMF